MASTPVPPEVTSRLATNLRGSIRGSCFLRFGAASRNQRITAVDSGGRRRGLAGRFHHDSSSLVSDRSPERRWAGSEGHHKPRIDRILDIKVPIGEKRLFTLGPSGTPR